MTNLQALLEVIKLDEKDMKQAILDNFSNQDDDEFGINGEAFKFFTKSDLYDLLYEDFSNKFSELEDYALDSQYGYLLTYVDFDIAADAATEQALKRPGSFEGYDFIDTFEDKYIYSVY